MALDPSISLSVNTQGPDMGRAISLAAAMQQFQQNQRKAAAQNTLRAIFSDPSNLDTSGALKPGALSKVMAVDPGTGIQLQQQQSKLQEQQLQADVYKTELFGKKLGMVDSAWGKAQEAYDQAKKSGMTEEASRDAGQRELDSGLEDIDKGGVFSEQEREHLVRKYDPVARGRLSATYQAWKQANEKQALEERKTTATERRADALETVAMGGGKGAWQILTDPTKKDADGNPTQYRYNATTTEATTLDGKPYTPGGAAKIAGGGSSNKTFTPQMGDLMASLAEHGVALPTGFRSREQQIQLYQGLLDRNPGKSADQIANMIKTGQIEFGAQKKETQTAAGVAGKVEVAQNEIEEFIPLVRDASAKVARTQFVPINRLLQATETSLSDPNLKALKIRINSLLNAYDMLAARGGTDMEKRREVRNLLMSADSPEALEAGLKSFELEAAAAHRAAVKATKVPELPESPSGTTKPKGKLTSMENTSDAENQKIWDGLKSGEHFIDPKGIERIKP